MKDVFVTISKVTSAFTIYPKLGGVKYERYKKLIMCTYGAGGRLRRVIAGIMGVVAVWNPNERRTLPIFGQWLVTITYNNCVLFFNTNN